MSTQDIVCVALFLLALALIAARMVYLNYRRANPAKSPLVTRWQDGRAD